MEVNGIFAMGGRGAKALPETLAWDSAAAGVEGSTPVSYNSSGRSPE